MDPGAGQRPGGGVWARGRGPQNSYRHNLQLSNAFFRPGNGSPMATNVVVVRVLVVIRFSIP